MQFHRITVNTQTHLNPRTAALLTVDVQNDFVLPGAPAEIEGTWQRIPQMVQLLRAFRSAQQPIIHLVRLYLPDGSNVDRCRRDMIRAGQQIVKPDTAGAELVEVLKPSPAVRLEAERLLQGQVQSIGPQEWILYKPRWGAFYRTPLEGFLTQHGIDSLVFCGCNFPNCPRASIYEASERDFRIALATDAVSGIYAEGLSELARIGIVLQETAALIAWLTSDTQPP